jgi:hypothetical protein
MKTDWSMDFADIQKPLEDSCYDTAWKVEHQWPKALVEHWPARVYLSILCRAARTTFRTVAYVAADVRQGQSDWRWDYLLAVPLMNRTLLDSIFNCVFLLEDIPARSKWFHESGWKESMLELKREEAAYGSDPAFKSFLASKKERLSQNAKRLHLDTAAAMARKEWWPNPGKIPHYGFKKGEVLPDHRQFLLYLNDWFYGPISSQSHHGFYGLQQTGMYYLAEEFPKGERQDIERTWPSFRAEQVVRSSVLTLALLSELEKHFDLGLATDFRQLWQKLLGAPEAKEVYEKRYLTFF